MDKIEIGKMIKARRDARGWSQKDLAIESGLSESAISMYERGDRKPSTKAKEALADAFNVPVWAIEYREDEFIPLSKQEEAELWRIRESFRRNPELRTLFDLQSKATAQELKQMVAFIKAIRGSNENTD